MAAIVLVASFLIAPLVSPGSAASGALVVPTTLGRAISFAALVAFGAALFTWCWSEGRRTLPMKTWRLALTDLAGQPVSRRRAFARYLAVWIGPALALVAYALLEDFGWGAVAWPMLALNWLTAWIDPERQFLHDRIAGTRLVVTA